MPLTVSIYQYFMHFIDNTTKPYSHTSLGYNPPKKFVTKKQAQKDMMMNSFDNILAPLEVRSNSDQISPFGSTKTFEKISHTDNKFDANRTLERCNTSGTKRKTFEIKENLGKTERSMTQYNDQENNSYVENFNNVTHTKNASYSDSKFASYIDTSGFETVKSGSKYNMSKYHTESKTLPRNSPMS